MLDLHDVLLPVGEDVAGALEKAALAAPLFSRRSLLTTWPALRDELRARAGSSVYDELVMRIRERLAARHHAVVIRGLRFDAGDRVLVGVSTGLGEIVHADRGDASTAVDVLRPSIDLEYGAATETLHTDAACWREPNRYTCQLVVTVDEAGGGESMLLSLDDLFDQLLARGRAALLDFLRSEPLPWTFGSRPPADRGTGPLSAPILHGARIRWLRSAIAMPDRQRLDEPTLRCLEEFVDFLQTCPAVRRSVLHSYDLLILDNHRTLHGRGPVRDPRRSAREVRRILVR